MQPRHLRLDLLQEPAGLRGVGTCVSSTGTSLTAGRPASPRPRGRGSTPCPFGEGARCRRGETRGRRPCASPIGATRGAVAPHAALRLVDGDDPDELGERGHARRQDATAEDAVRGADDGDSHPAQDDTGSAVPLVQAPGGEKQLVVEILDLPDGTVEIEAGALPGPGRLPETSPKRLAFEQAGERVREVRRVARLDEETLHAVFDDLRQAADAGRDHRLPGTHVLHDRKGRAFEVRADTAMSAATSTSGMSLRVPSRSTQSARPSSSMTDSRRPAQPRRRRRGREAPAGGRAPGRPLRRAPPPPSRAEAGTR